VLIVPADVVQAIAPEEVNCSVAPSFTETAVGDMACRLSSVTVAEADPPDPFAVTVTELEEGMLEGAV
jgi:hypothetical protein